MDKTTETPGTQPASSTQPSKPYGRNWKKLILIYLIIGAILYGGIYYFVLSKQNSKPYSTPVSKSISSPTPDPTADWKTYTNNKFNYSIRYPSATFFNCSKDGFELFKGVDESTCTAGETPTDFYIQTVGNSTNYKESNECVTVNKQHIKLASGISATKYTYARTAMEGPCQKYNGYPKSAHYEILIANTLLDIYIFEKEDLIKNQILQTFKFTDQAASQSSTKYLSVDAWKVRLPIGANLANLDTLPPEKSIYSSTATDQMVKVLAQILMLAGYAPVVQELLLEVSLVQKAI